MCSGKTETTFFRRERERERERESESERERGMAVQCMVNVRHSYAVVSVKGTISLFILILSTCMKNGQSII